MSAEHRLAYDAPAAEWLEALPLGNGRLGAMVFGGSPADGGMSHRFQLNDSSAWSGSPHSQDRKPVFSREEADRILSESRRLISSGDFAGAAETLKGLQHRHSQAYLPFADLHLTAAPAATPTAGPAAGPPSDYHRGLDLATAVSTNTYCLEGHAVRVEALISHDPSMLVISLLADAPEGVDLSLRLDSPLRVLRRTADRGTCSLELKLPSDAAPAHDGGLVEYSEDESLSLQGAAAVSWAHDGQDVDAPGGTAGHDGGLAATGVRRADVFVTTATTFAGLGRHRAGDAASAAAEARGVLELARASSPSTLKERHQESHSRLYRAARIELDVPAWEGTDTGRRLLAANAHPGGPLAADPGLAALLFNYGRYLLISSSRPGPAGSGKGSAWRGVPANLQGLWNAELPAPWSSNYTTNINLQMNYWGAEPTGLAECVEPLFALIEAMQVTGAAVAREYYGARGWTVHHNSDIWAYAKPVGHGAHSPEWSYWPMAGLWLVRHLWEHLQFGAATVDRDKAGFARDAAWPAIRGAAEFALDLLAELPDGSLGTGPSTSPENTFAAVDPSSGRRIQGSVAQSSTMDLTLTGDVFRMLDALGRDLGMDADPVLDEARRALPRLPAPEPGRDGKLREWLADPEEWEPGHRHVSHLYLAYPGDTPLSAELEAAVRASLDGRGDEATGWSLAWKILLRSRLRQPEKVSDLLRLFFRDMSTPRGGQSGGLYPNLFGAHPPFQIDGNLGFVAGLAECLLQSHRLVDGLHEIELLPALPAELPAGRAAGLRARPGVEVDLGWQDGRLVRARLATGEHRRVLVRHGTAVQDVRLRPGTAAVLTVSPAGTLLLEESRATDSTTTTTESTAHRGAPTPMIG
ncbi:glycoside hydrolase family 95 protein [Pseudarthrobacter phenanthrenivorans]|uniref:glycosyl hydrolase family 95 catalytic domain-containing protein n=1 Tax=Pseudarthrobacter phenanthrenivorans TaxID=361575 RepID=UPI00112E1EAA|nr:glycoside hydrolase N-terminal domain-containing protein [Pseudarthrobacter phenanthrenivorans]TPV52418.1 glycoside hydrolase family 95 protein [Pseudarthrobacter phenanthrenivorans]